MEEVETKPPVKTGKTRRRKLLDVVLVLLFVALCLILAKNLINQINLKNEVKEATTTSDQVIAAIQKKDGKAARNLSYKTFQADNTADNLKAQFTSISKFTSSTPVVRHTVVTNDDAGQAVSVIYKFSSKPAIYVRVLVIKPNGSESFKMAKLNVDTSEKKLLDIAQ